MMRCVSGAWEVEVHRDLEPLLKAWSDRLDKQATAIVHVGFNRSPSRTFDDCAMRFPGKVLLTAAAKYALPTGYEASTNPIAEIDGQTVYLATKGWGYDASHLTTPRLPGPVPNFVVGWLSEFVSVHPDKTDTILEAEINNNESYLTNEHHLSTDLRQQMGIFRFNSLIGTGHDDPCAFAQAAPPWLTEQEFSSMNLTVRISNVFKQSGIIRVADLRKLCLVDLFRLKNFGRTSVTDLLNILRTALAKGPRGDSISESGLAGQSDNTLLEAVNRTMASFSPRVCDVLKRRMGLNGPPETLAEVGNSYGLTRERIRQIESKALNHLVAFELWDDLLAMKLKKLLVGRHYPLPLLGVEAIEPWFEGIGEHAEVIRYLLSNVTDASVSLIEVDGIEFFSFMTPLQWETTVCEAKRLLAASADNQCTEDYCKTITSALLPESATEFTSLLWKKASEHCVFIGLEGMRTLRAHGRGAEHIIAGVLDDILEPLHYSKIVELASERAGRTFDLRRGYQAVSQHGLLFGPGTYGLRKHLKLSETEMESLAQAAEDLILEEGPDRQWHSYEIMGLLSERSPEVVPEGANKYVIDIALSGRCNLRRLGRMVWAAPGALSEASRLEVYKTILTVLRTAGRPLTTEEIRQRVCAIRGVSDVFQISANDPILKIGKARWGLNDRDISVKKESQPLLINEIVQTLRRRTTGIHISEKAEFLGNNILVPPEEIFALSILDSRLAVSQGHYLYLREWGAPRRETVLNGVRSIMIEAAGQPMSVEMIATMAGISIGRDVDKLSIYGALKSLEARLVSPGIWQYDPVAHNVEDEDDHLEHIEGDKDDVS